MRSRIHLLKRQSHPHRSDRVHGYEFVYLRLKKIFRTPQNRIPSKVRLRNKLYWTKAELDNALTELDQHKVERYVHKQGCEWLFNLPHASHFGGAWERQMGTIRRVLDAMFAELGSAQLTHELLVTLMAEVTAIVNARPIALVPKKNRGVL